MFNLPAQTLSEMIHGQYFRLVACLLMTGFILTVYSGFAQKQSSVLSRFADMKPRNIGPAGMSGRITAIDAVVEDPRQIWLGAASGGVWKTDNGGMSWASVFDEQPILNIGSLAIQQNNPSTVWVGTGEGNPRNSLNLGEGIYRTLDAGKTWQRMGLEKTRNIHRILIDPLHPQTVYAGVIGNPYAPHPERGVFKTTDGGANWERILYTNDSSGIGDMIMDPANPNKIFAAMWQHYRTPWSLMSGGRGSGLYMTVDGGRNWKQLGKAEGLPDGHLGRIGLAISRSRPERVYALVEATKNGLYMSDDGGYHWTLVNSNSEWVTNRPFYFQDIACDPQNENRLWMINQMISVSEDGGKNFKNVIPYNGIHPDHHAFWIHPKDGNFIIDGNDGGIGITRDRGAHWIFDEKLPVGQFYHINVDNEIPYNVMGGMQDNGSWRGPAYIWSEGGIRNYHWKSLWSGDGFDVMPDPHDAEWVYAMSQGGSVGRYNVRTGQQWYIKPVSTDPSVRFRFNWNAAIAQDPFDKSTIYFGSQFLHRSTSKGAAWQTISPDLTTNDSAKIDQSKNGGLSLDITGAENFCTILTIAPSPLEKDVIWVGTDDGNVQLTRDGGRTWTNFRGKIPGMPVGGWIPQIQASRHVAGEAFVVCNDYRRGDMKPYIFRTSDYGKTWTRMVDEKKVTGYTLCVLQDPTEPNLIFAGSEQGLWVSLDNGITFEQWKHGFPPVSTFDMAIQEREADLVIATFGRSLWVLDDIRPLRSLASAKGKISKPFMLYPSPMAVQAQFTNMDGYEWSTWGLWEAPNRPREASIAWFSDADTSAAERKKKGIDTVSIRILDEKGHQVRQLRMPSKSGFNRQYWGMEGKGTRMPGSPKPKPGAPEPGGQPVMPGKYTIVASLGDRQDTTLITVADDPRLGDRTAVRQAQQALRDRLMQMAQPLTAALDRLSEAEEAAGRIETAYKDDKGAMADSIRKSTKSVQDSIKAIREFISGKRSTAQGYGQVPRVTVMSQFQQALQAIGARPLEPGEPEKMLVEEAGRQLSHAVGRIDAWLGSSWPVYQELVKSHQPDLFRAR
jgi:photosystem II stability/assembly factor-like uncharacterized protein